MSYTPKLYGRVKRYERRRAARGTRIAAIRGLARYARVIKHSLERPHGAAPEWRFTYTRARVPFGGAGVVLDSLTLKGVSVYGVAATIIRTLHDPTDPKLERIGLVTPILANQSLSIIEGTPV